MLKIWLIVALILALVLAIVLTVTFVIKDKNDNTWIFYLEDKSSNKPEKTLCIDLRKSSNYSKNGNKVNVKHFSQDLDGARIEGYTHKFENPVNLMKISHYKEEIVPKRTFSSEGFTVFFKSKKPDFVTLWHDGEFHHYGTNAKLLTLGPFPFDGGSGKKHPNFLDLPRGEDILPLIDIDLDLVTTPNEKHNYTFGSHEVTVTPRPFGGFYRILNYNIKDFAPFSPVIKFGGNEHKLPSNPKVTTISAVVTEDNLPVLVSFVYKQKIHSFVHKGDNHWDEIDVTLLSYRSLDQSLCRLTQSAMLDFSNLSGTYKGGEYDIEVSPCQDLPNYEGFVCFTHKLVRRNDVSETGLEAPICVYRVTEQALGGLPKEKVSFVAAYYWKHNPENPLLLKVKVGKDLLDYYGFYSYSLEKDHTKLPVHLEEINFFLHYLIKINLEKHEQYHFNPTNPYLKFIPYIVFVERTDNNPVKGFTRNTHRFRRTGRSKTYPFRLQSIKDIEIPPSGRQLTHVDSYYFNKTDKKPLFFVLNYLDKPDYYLLEDDKYVEKDYHYFSKLEENFKTLSYKKLEVLYLNPGLTMNYYEDDDDDVKVEVVEEKEQENQLQKQGSEDKGQIEKGEDQLQKQEGGEKEQKKEEEVKYKKFRHTFKEVKSVRFLYKSVYYDTAEFTLGKKINEALVFTDEDIRPFFITLKDTDYVTYNFKYSGDEKWEKVDSFELNSLSKNFTEEILPKDPLYSKKESIQLYPQ